MGNVHKQINRPIGLFDNTELATCVTEELFLKISDAFKEDEWSLDLTDSERYCCGCSTE